MAEIVIPSIIQGPAYIGHGGVINYTESDVEVEEIVESWTPKSTLGDEGERHKSRMYRISYTPVGMVTEALLNYFYAAHLAPQNYVGRSIIPDANDAVVIYSFTENKTRTFRTGGIGAPPDLYAGPLKTAFGKMSLLAIGKRGVVPTDAHFMKAAEAAIGAADTSYDSSKIISDIYEGVLGALEAPYDSLGAMEGFSIKFGYKTKNIPAGDVGIAEVILDSDGFNIGAQFAPSNLTEAQLDTLLGIQDADAVLPGQAYGSAAQSGDLVLTGASKGWEFSIKQLGAKSCKRIYKIGEHRFPNGALEMVSDPGSAAGVRNPLFAFTPPA